MADISEDMECLCHLMKTVGSQIDVAKARVRRQLCIVVLNITVVCILVFSVCYSIEQIWITSIELALVGSTQSRSGDKVTWFKSTFDTRAQKLDYMYEYRVISTTYKACCGQIVLGFNCSKFLLKSYWNYSLLSPVNLKDCNMASDHCLSVRIQIRIFGVTVSCSYWNTNIKM